MIRKVYGRTVWFLRLGVQFITGFVAEEQTQLLSVRRGFTALLQGIQWRGKTERDENVT